MKFGINVTTKRTAYEIKAFVDYCFIEGLKN